MESKSNAPSIWDMHNFAMYSGKGIEIPKHLKPSSHEIEVGKGIDTETSFSQGVLYSNASVHHSSSKNVDSTSWDASAETLKDASVVAYCLPEDNSSRKEDLIGADKGDNFSGPGAAYVCFGKPMANLKLLRPEDSENMLSASTARPSVSLLPVSSSASKRSRMIYQSTQASRCQVEGCNLDLTSAKDYHRRHRICESHSKSPKVIVAGMERRFCQQCSRFHNLSEFDDKKRSCRRRLSDHNARRRRPQPDAVHFSPTGLSSSIYDGRPQNFLLDSIPTSASHTSWGSFCSLKMTQSGDSLIRPSDHSDRKQIRSNQTPNIISMQYLNSGSSHLNETPVHPRALSLLSTTSWGLNEPQSSTSLEQLMQGSVCMSQPVMQLESQSWPLMSSGHVSAEQAPSITTVNSVDLHIIDSSQFQDFQSFKTNYEPNLYYSSRID